MKKIRQIGMLVVALMLTVGANAGEPCNELPSDPNDIRPLLIGQAIPNTSLKDVDGKVVLLADLIRNKPALVIFYRGSWCPYCNVHLGELAKLEPKLLELGFQIIAISPDQPAFLKESIDKNELKYTVLSDSNVEAAKGFGLAYTVDAKMLEKLAEYDIDLEKHAGADHHVLPVPAAFLVSQNGRIEFSHVAPDYTTRVNTDVILTAAHRMFGAQ